MHRRLRILSYLCCALLVVFAPACSDDDGGSPTGPGGGGTTGDPATDAAIEQGLLISDALVAMMPQWAAGNLVGPPTKEAVYNPVCQCWVWEYVDGNPFANPYDYTMWNFTATFYAGETVVQNPQESDHVVIVVNYNWERGFYPLNEEGGDDESTSFTAGFTLNVSPTGGNPVSVSGSGQAEYLSVGSKNGEFFEYYGTFGVSLELSVPLGGCPSGTMNLEEGSTLFSISYDGTNTAHWTLSRGEQGNPISGSDTFVCPSN